MYKSDCQHFKLSTVKDSVGFVLQHNCFRQYLQLKVSVSNSNITTFNGTE